MFGGNVDATEGQLAEAATARAEGPTAFEFGKVHPSKIYPGIGIVSVGGPTSISFGQTPPYNPHNN
jgi:hypothetical protein